VDNMGVNLLLYAQKKISWRPIFYINENLNVNINVNLNANLTSKNF